ncbi:protein of unknown function [Xenorhabdus poinarii G6]|uniref:Uncharacterized protein n=1 Tax=Xenorhabdus poinarii G6 TaxID=1354304 RepID=A0A068R0J1_9GAMM|nr:protein of unknown function [Xenorhabdus poinarii G6]
MRKEIKDKNGHAIGDHGKEFINSMLKMKSGVIYVKETIIPKSLLCLVS